MLYRLAARAHVALIHATDAARRSERGQGTVEYVALVLLVGTVLAAVVVAARGKGFGGSSIAKAIVDHIKDAMGEVGGK